MAEAGGKLQKKISFELNIKSAWVDLPDQTYVTIYWVRGRVYNLNKG